MALKKITIEFSMNCLNQFILTIAVPEFVIDNDCSMMIIEYPAFIT